MAATPRKLRLCEGGQIFLRGKNLDINKQATIDCFKKKNECCTRKSSGVMKRTQANNASSVLEILVTDPDVLISPAFISLLSWVKGLCLITSFASVCPN